MRTKRTCPFCDDIWIGHSQRVDRHLFCTREKYARHVAHGGDASADRKRDADGVGHFSDHLDINGATLCGGGDVVEDQLIATLFVVAGCHFYRVAKDNIVFEFDAFCYALFMDVEAGDDTFRQHVEPSQSEKFLRRRSPMRPDFSG